MVMVEKLIEKVLKSYNGSFSELRKNILLGKVRKFNTTFFTSFWLEIREIKETGTYVYIGVRKGGKDGSIIYIRNFRRGNMKNVFENETAKLVKEKEGQSSPSKTEKIIQLEFNF